MFKIGSTLFASIALIIVHQSLGNNDQLALQKEIEDEMLAIRDTMIKSDRIPIFVDEETPHEEPNEEPWPKEPINIGELEKILGRAQKHLEFWVTYLHGLWHHDYPHKEQIVELYKNKHTVSNKEQIAKLYKHMVQLYTHMVPYKEQLEELHSEMDQHLKNINGLIEKLALLKKNIVQEEQIKKNKVGQSSTHYSSGFQIDMINNYMGI